MSDRVLMTGLLGFASGILCRSFFFFAWHVPVLMLLIAGALLIVWTHRRLSVYVIAVALCVGVALGMGRVMLEPEGPSMASVALLGQRVEVVGRVAREPDVREQSQRLVVEAESFADDRVLVVAPLYPEVSVGDRIEARGTLVRPEPFGTETGRVFRYDRFLAKDRIFLLVERASLDRVSESNDVRDRVINAALGVKRAFQDGLADALPEPHASLASGLITGGKQGLGAALLDAFVISGLVHIVVLSGYNVMIVAEAVLRALSFLSRRTAAIAAAAVIGMFVLVAGAGAASVRAGLMAGLALTARATGRTYAVLRALAAAAAVMLMINPLLLAFDPGFQLSFLATLGLILGAPRIAARLKFVRSEFWRELLASTLAAQLSVLPLLLYQTGMLALVSVPANLLVLPTVPAAMLAGTVAGVAGFIVPVAAPVVALPALLLLSYIVTIAEASAALPFSSATVPQFPFALVILSYAALVFWIWKTPAGRTRPAGV